jgi:hypothetical protein
MGHDQPYCVRFSVHPDRHGRVSRDQVRAACRDEYRGPPLVGQISLVASLWVPRPRSHYVPGIRWKQVRPDAPCKPREGPTPSQLVRALDIALRGVLWSSDRQVVVQNVRKRYENQMHGPELRIVVAVVDDVPEEE